MTPPAAGRTWLPTAPPLTEFAGARKHTLLGTENQKEKHRNAEKLHANSPRRLARTEEE